LNASELGDLRPAATAGPSGEVDEIGDHVDGEALGLAAVEDAARRVAQVGWDSRVEAERRSSRKGYCGRQEQGLCRRERCDDGGAASGDRGTDGRVDNGRIVAVATVGGDAAPDAEEAGEAKRALVGPRAAERGALDEPVEAGAEGARQGGDE